MLATSALSKRSRARLMADWEWLQDNKRALWEEYGAETYVAIYRRKVVAANESPNRVEHALRRLGLEKRALQACIVDPTIARIG